MSKVMTTRSIAFVGLLAAALLAVAAPAFAQSPEEFQEEFCSSFPGAADTPFCQADEGGDDGGDTGGDTGGGDTGGGDTGGGGQVTTPPVGGVGTGAGGTAAAGMGATSLLGLGGAAAAALGFAARRFFRS